MSADQARAGGLEPDALRARIAGDVYTAADPAWDTERAAWNLAVDQHPAAVAVPANKDDVVTIVRAAREAGVRVAPQSTGHNAFPLGDLSSTILLKTSRLRDVEVDAGSRVARIGGGVTWGDVAGPAAEAGLMPVQGSSHDVGVAGYALGGGVSLLSRTFGLACEQLRSIEVVSGDGELRRVDADNDPDLFWALRGGGGSFGVVTEMEMGLMPVEQVYAGAMFFAVDRSAEVLKAWRRWAGTLPDEMGTVGSIRHFPPFPEVPEPVRGQSFVIVEAFWVGDPAEADELLAPMRELGPQMDNIARVDAVGLLPVHMDPPGPVSGIGQGRLLTDFDEDAIDRVVELVGSPPEGPPVMFEARQLGGALAKRAEGCGALGAFDADWLAFIVGVLPVPEMAAAVRAGVAAVDAAIEPLDAGARYLNYTEQPVGIEAIFPPETVARLREIHDRYDCGIFQANHPVGA